MKIRRLVLGAAAICALPAIAMNPYLPLWEHTPDGEPYLFEDPDVPGKQRVYVYGSHDMLKTNYCGTNLVVWSASPDSLEKWRYEGVIFESRLDAEGKPLNDNGLPDVLFAPDVTEVKLPNGEKKYYMVPNTQAENRYNMVAVSDRPDGPFKVCNWDGRNPKATVGVFGFDPAIFMDDDGRVYGYWGFKKSHGAELDPKTMSTLKPGTEIVENMVGNVETENDFRFFEASSMRKIEDKYVLIYSRQTKEGEFGMPSTNYTLAYAYSDNPLGPFTYGGTIIDGRGRDTDKEGNAIATATPFGNTHGSILKINGQWWVFYHRQSGTDEYARQAMVAPIEVKVEKGRGGKVEISEAEYTSEGFERGGLNPLRRYPAAIASHITGPTPARQSYPNVEYSGPYFESAYISRHDIGNPYDEELNVSKVVNCTDGSILGYKYFNFDNLKGAEDVELVLSMTPQGIEGEIEIYVEAPWRGKAEPIGKITLQKEMAQTPQQIGCKVSGVGKLSGRHPLYLKFKSDEKGKSMAEITHIQFKV